MIIKSGLIKLSAALAGAAALALLTAAPVSAAGASATDGKIVNPFAGDKEAIDEGKELFFDTCADCHGSGTGGVGPNLVDDEWIYGGSDAKVFESISGGRGMVMPAWSLELEDTEIWKVMAFIRSRNREIHMAERALMQGKSLFETHCSRCHGDGTGGRGPNLLDEKWLYGGSHADVMKSITGGRGDVMPAWESKLDRKEIRHIIAYLRSIKKK